MSANDGNRNQEEDDSPSLDDLRQMGNHHFSKGDYDSALSLYTAAVEKADETKNRDALVLNLCNRSACLFKMERYEEAQDDASQAVDTSQGKNVKALFRLAKTQIALKSFNNALDTIDGAMSVLDDGQRKAFKDLAAEAKKAADVEGEMEESSIVAVSRNISIREFIKEKELGVGNFTEILQCRHKKTGERFALKVIEKKQAADLAKRQHPNVYNEIQMERRILLERLPQHINIVRMYHAFQDYNSLYYLMELYRKGGDMWSTLRYDQKMVGCHRSLVKVYLAELLDAMEHMHSHGIVHRDLKTENMLLSPSGHVIVIDFGTAKDLIQTDLNGPEFVGTPDFMSPEAVRGDSDADHTADLWAFGAVAYQYHTGQTPFWSPSPYLTFLKIKRGNLMRPWGIADDDAWDLIRSLMKMDPKERLGADGFQVRGNIKKTVVKHGYDAIRNHPYFSKRSESTGVPPLDPDYKDTTPIPSLRDLCVRPCSEQIRRDALDLELCDRHPPGDGSAHDTLRLDPRDRRCVMHMLDRRGLLHEPTILRRFFDSTIGYRLDKIRKGSRDYVGLTRMADDQGKFPNPNEHDPYADPKQPIDPIHIVHVTNPLFTKSVDKMNDETRKHCKALLKKSLLQINRTRPKLVVVSGRVDTPCRKLLARINDSIPVVVVDGSTYFSFWHSGVQCLALPTHDVDSDQILWLREELEQCKMAKNLLFVFLDGDPRELSDFLLKKITRGHASMLVGISEEGLESVMTYTANETMDDNASIRSTDSEEQPEVDNHMMRIVATQENGIRWITILERDEWNTTFKPILQ